MAASTSSTTATARERTKATNVYTRMHYSAATPERSVGATTTTTTTTTHLGWTNCLHSKRWTSRPIPIPFDQRRRYSYSYSHYSAATQQQEQQQQQQQRWTHRSKEERKEIWPPLTSTHISETTMQHADLNCWFVPPSQLQPENQQQDYQHTHRHNITTNTALTGHFVVRKRRKSSSGGSRCYDGDDEDDNHIFVLEM